MMALTLGWRRLWCSWLAASVAALGTSCASTPESTSYECCCAHDPGPARAPSTAALSAPQSGEITSVWQTLGSSSGGRSIEAATFGNGPGRVYLIGGIHGDERPGGENIERVIELLQDPDSLTGLSVRVVRDLNPDGTANARRRNERGVDLNRNWPASNFRASSARGSAPLSEAETSAVYPDLLSFLPDLVIVFHAARSGPFVNYDGPARELAEAFAAGTAQTGARWRVQSDMGYPTPGSLGSLVGRDWNVPILTLEFARGQDTDEAWLSLSGGLFAVLKASAGAVAIDS